MTVVLPTIVLSNPLKVDILAYRGDSGRFRIAITEPNGDPVDISSMTWDGDIRLTADAVPIISFDFELVVGEINAVDVILTFEDSALLPKKAVYDVQMKSGLDVTTLIYGTIRATQDVSRT